MQLRVRGKKEVSGMKRALLIAGGTVGGLGAVLSITPPQLGSNGISTLAGASADTSVPATTNSAAVTTATPAAKKSAAAVATKKATTTTKKATSTATKSATSSNTNSSSSTTANSSNTTNTTTETAAPAPAGVSGTFTGDAFNVSYGMVQVKITVSNGKITDAVAVQAPSGRSQRFTDYSVPNLRQQTLAAQSAAIRGVGGASYTSYGWYKSLITALQKAGMPTGV